MCKRIILLLLCSIMGTVMYAQTKKVTGKILSEDNSPLVGATIQVKNGTMKATSNAKGEFSIAVPASGEIALEISFVTFITQTVVVKSDEPVLVIMKAKQTNQDEVVVVGYGTVKKKDLTGSVEKVNMKDLAKAPVRSFEEALGGRVAGVQVVSSDGQPGAPVSIVIRGNNSVTQDNSPLYVIDGFPVENPNNNSINVTDIESIEILKDASATAIYGARGANGVVMITTKKGKTGQTDISYNTYFGMNQIIKEMQLLSPYEFVKFQFQYDSINTKTYYLNNGRTIDDYKNAKGSDWQNLIFRNAMVMSHELAIRGGNGNTRFSLSGSALNQEGIIKNSGYNRYQGRFRLDQILNDHLKVGFNANYSAMKAYGTIPSSMENSSSQTSNLMYSVWGYRPITGDSTSLVAGVDPLFELNLNDSRFNPLETVTYEVRNRYTNSITGNLAIDYQVIKNLTFRTTFGYNSDVDRNEEFNGTNTSGGSPYTASGRVNGVNGSIIYNKINRFVNENTFSYFRKLNSKQNLDVVGGFTFQNNEQKIFGAAATNLPNEQLGLSGLDEGTPTKISSYLSNNRLASFLGRVNYSYDSKYLFTASFRADGSSKFAPGNKWSYFPSGSFAWRFSKEKFMDHVNFVKDAKFRISYGMVGNNRVSDFAYLSSLSTQLTLIYPFNSSIDNNTVIPTALGNPNLKWETTSQVNAGLDLSLFEDKIIISTDVYRKVTSDLLLNALLPPSSGFTSAYKNIGKVENKGFEFSINTRNLDRGNVHWSSSFNISFNRNKVLALNENQESILTPINWDNQWRGTPAYIAKVGQPLGLMYGMIWEGNYQYSDFEKSAAGVYTLKPGVPTNTSVYDPAGVKPGYIKYKDLNGDKVINDDDRTIIGNANPDFIGGFSNNLKIGNFDWNMFFQFSYGNDILNANRLVFEGNSGRTLQNQFASVINRWTPDNQNNIMFVAHGGGDKVYSSRVVEDGSYLRLKTLQFGYTLPAKLLKRIKIRTLRFYVSAQNLVTWTKYAGLDPEVSAYNSALTPGFDYSVYPRARTYTVGLNLNF